MARAEDLRKLVRRDWALLARAKDAFWIDRRRRIPAAAALKAADELRRHIHAVRPDWPTPADREADLAAHLHVAAVLRRASPLSDR